MNAKRFLSTLTLLSVTLLSACGKAPEPPISNDFSPLAEHYVRLVLALGEHDGSYVDAYYGPAEWPEQVKQSEKSAADIASAARTLQAQVTAEQLSDPMLRLRQHYLAKQLTALISHADTLASGSRAGFEQQAQALYDTLPPQHALSSFEPILQQLEQLVPGEGNLTERVVAYRQQFVIPQDKLQPVFEQAISECKARSASHLALPAHESFTLEFVQDKPWSGYNWFKGNAFSLIQINTERPIDISRAVDLGCHEGYPGHHAYNALLEQHLSKDLGWVEFSVYPLFSPQSLIAEGTANYGIEMAFPGEQKLAYERDVLYPLAGLDASKAADYDRFLKLLAQLSYAGNETARLYLNNEIDAEQFVALQQQYLLQSEAEARQRLRFVEAYGAYVINYNWGKDLVKAYIEQASTEDERWQRFMTLLTTPRLPSSMDW
ncbi:hypothetical protein GCM10010919_03720 [Alishewanella longhuensis]|uniref:DUF885 domain-containing protein n=1 Tax=Alishewanella longhuensis TaxID=1091037 RepID=A0ABQ3L2B2_9ALTE|nr:hypothetical protein [Alishewanella longhuensis]GHG60332.1 hypothetical protein GCM10010919_03720 [Alishewanella longhuensis]